jgi:hypothetical protein
MTQSARPIASRTPTADRRRTGGAAMLLATSPILAAAILVACFFMIGIKGATVPHPGANGIFEDFDAFYIVGLLAQEGRLAEAYRLADMAAAQRAIAGAEMFMPWTYPPPFNLVVAVLPVLPRGLAYLAFMGLTLIAYVWVLRRLAGAHLTAVLVALLPALTSNIASGQNGFLTGALAGAACIAALQGRAVAGVPLGLMVLKPHLGVALGVWALAAGRWREVAVAAAVALGLLVLATAILGADVWTAFRGGVAEAAALLAGGHYLLFRMVSAYSVVHMSGAPAAVAMGLQAGVALVALAGVALAARRAAQGRLPLRLALALACAAMPLVSPYAYDYDLAAAGVALALVMPDLLARMRPAEGLGLLALVWLATGWGTWGTMRTLGLPTIERVALQAEVPAVAGVALLAGIVWAVLILRRAATDEPGPT